MFESKEELRMARLFDERFPEVAKEMIATSVQARCSIALDAASDKSAMGIPRSKMFAEACNLTFVINKVLTNAIDASNTPTMSYEEAIVGRGRPMVHYLVDGFSLHIKKNQKADHLPKGAIFRMAETEENRQMSLDFGAEIQMPVYLIVTYNHKNFRLRYVQIGIASYDYTSWLHRWNLADYIRQERVEVMRNEYGPAIRENFVEHISKKYHLEMRN